MTNSDARADIRCAGFRRFEEAMMSRRSRIRPGKQSNRRKAAAPPVFDPALFLATVRSRSGHFQIFEEAGPFCTGRRRHRSRCYESM